MNIIHITSGDLWAGAEVQVYQTISALREKNTLSVMCVLFNGGILYKKLCEKNIKTIVIDESRFNSFIILIKLIGIINNNRPDIIHVHGVKEHFLGTLASLLFFRRIHIVRTVHGLSGVFKNLSLKEHLRTSTARILDKILIKYITDALVAVSKDLEQDLLNHNVKAKVYQIYNSINVNDYKKIKDGREIRDKYQVGNRFWIGTAARLVETKKLNILIKTGQNLATQGILFKISIFGDGPLKEELQALIEKCNLSDIVELHGFEPEILPLINAMDVFVLCSEHEGIPMAILEAMSLMTPVVCTAVGGMKEVIEQDINGLLVPPNDITSLTEALIRIYKDKDLASRLVSNGRNTIEKKFLIEGASKQLYNLYSNFFN